MVTGQVLGLLSMARILHPCYEKGSESHLKVDLGHLTVESK